MKNKLTIAIPTFNRKKAVLKLLREISDSNYKDLYEIIVCDNASQYDIEEEIKSLFDKDFVDKCRIIIRPFNIGGEGNIKNLFLLCKTKWLWVIGDDDDIVHDAISIVLKDIESDSECAFFKYSFYSQIGEKDGIVVEDDYEMKNLSDFIEYYNIKQRSLGSMTFMSNNIFNMEKLAPYIRYYFDYTTCLQIFPIIMALDTNTIRIRYRSKKICKYNEPEKNDHWNVLYVLLCFSMLQFVPYKSIDSKSKASIMRVFTFINFRTFVSWCISNKDTIKDWKAISYLYHRYYVYTRKPLDYVLYVLLKLEIVYHLCLYSNVKRIVHKFIPKDII